MYAFMYKESRSALNICGTLLSLFIFLRTKGSIALMSFLS